MRSALAARPVAPPMSPMTVDSARVSTRMLGAGRAHRPADADLARALRDGDQRGVGDDDNGRDERHERNRRSGQTHALGQGGHEVARGFRRDDVERVLGAGAEMPPRAHRHRGVILGGDDVGIAGRRLREHLQRGRGAERPFERGDRHPHVAIERDAACRALLCLDADDREPAARNPNRSPDGVEAREEGVGDGATGDDHLRTSDVFIGREEAARLDLDVPNRRRASPACR